MLTVCFRLLSIRHRHNSALPFVWLNALETRLAFSDTSYKQKTEEAVVEAIWQKNYISLQAILQRSGAMARRKSRCIYQ